MDNYKRLQRLEEEMQELQDSKFKRESGEGSPPVDPIERIKEKNKDIAHLERLRREYEEEQCKSGHSMQLPNRIRITRQIQELEHKIAQYNK